MTTLSRMFDASIPPASPPAGFAAVAGYIGGNTPHVWKPGEWAAFGRLRQFPIWVGAGRTDGHGDGHAAVTAALALGWAPGRPERRAIICDVEAEENPGYLDDFAGVVWDGGFQTFVYESLAAVPGNPGKEGIWLADWDGIADLPPLAAVLAHQYRPDVPYLNTQIDLSVVTDTFLAHGGQGPRRLS